MATTSRREGLPYRPAIDGLRALAVSAVVLYHLDGLGIAGGYLGVDLFFVISGYLITGLLCLEIESRGRIDFTGFYERRVRRLLRQSWQRLLRPVKPLHLRSGFGGTPIQPQSVSPVRGKRR